MALRRRRPRRLPDFLTSNPKRWQKWQEVRAWQRGDRFDPGGAPGARALLTAQRAGRLYLPDVPALREARFRSRAARELAQIVMLACLKMHQGGALLGTKAELAELAGCSPRTVYTAMRELQGAGWVESRATFHQGGPGSDGKDHLRREGPRRYRPGLVMLAAWDANSAVISLPRGRRLEACRPSLEARRRRARNEGGNGCLPHRKEPSPGMDVVLLTGGCMDKHKESSLRSDEVRRPGTTTTAARQQPAERSALDVELDGCSTVEEVNAVWARFLGSVPSVGDALSSCG